MKKILYIITQSEFGGAQRYIFDLATHIKNEFEVMVAAGPPATLRPPDTLTRIMRAGVAKRAGEDPDGELFRRLKSENIKYRYLSQLKRSINPFRDIIVIFQLRQLIKKEKPDIIHLNSSKAGALGSLAAKLATYGPKKVVYTAHGWAFNEPAGWLRKLAYFLAERLTEKFKDRIICVSNYDRRIAIKRGFSEMNLLTIHNGLDFDNLKFLEKEDATKKLFEKINSSPDSKNLIGTIANLYPTKGIEYLIEAANLIKTNHLSLSSNLLFVIIGEGPERKKLEKLIKKYDLETSFFLVGHLPDARQYLKAFDVFVLPSVKEGFPYAILEAMAAGVPIVASEVGGIPEMVSLHLSSVNERTVLTESAFFLSEPKNSQQLAENILYFLNSPKAAVRLAEKAQEIVKLSFGLTQMIKKTTQVYIW